MPGDFCQRVTASDKDELQRLNVGSLLALRTGGHVERHALVFLQRLEALALDSREVSEQIFAAFVRGDEAEAFGVIEPFYDASCHYNFLFQLSGLLPVYDRLKKQETNDRLTALLPRIQRSRIIPNKTKYTRFSQNKKRASKQFLKPIFTRPHLRRQYAKYRSSTPVKFVLDQTAFEQSSCAASIQQTHRLDKPLSDRANPRPRTRRAGPASLPGPAARPRRKS